MTDLSEILEFKFPGKSNGPTGTSDYCLRDDGQGPEIVLWNVAVLGPEPDASTLSDWQAEYEAAPSVLSLKPSLVAQARLTVEDGEVYGMDVSAGFGAAMLLDEGTFWLFFTNPQPDDAYLVFTQTRGVGLTVDVTEANTDYLEIVVRDNTGNPITPDILFVSIQRTQ